MKERTSELISVALVLIATAGVIVASVGYRMHSKPELELVAQAPENGNWDPPTLTVRKGRQVTLSIRNADAVTHGFYLPAFDLAVRELKAGAVERVTFAPDRAGEFAFYCNIWCGDYHMQMKGRLIVED